MTKYQRWYTALIMRAQHRQLTHNYVETHHVIPRALGGSDLPSNLVDLTYREHFLAHWLLTKIHHGHSRNKMITALKAMTLRASGERLIAGWQIEVVKRFYYEAIKKRIARRKAIRAADQQARERAGDAAYKFLQQFPQPKRKKRLTHAELVALKDQRAEKKKRWKRGRCGFRRFREDHPPIA